MKAAKAKEEVRELKGRGRLSTLIPSFPTPQPQIYLGSLNFYWLKIKQNMFFLDFSFRPFFLFPKRLCVL
jgi:hypothetical protein